MKKTTEEIEEEVRNITIAGQKILEFYDNFYADLNEMRKSRVKKQIAEAIKSVRDGTAIYVKAKRPSPMQLVDIEYNKELKKRHDQFL